MQDDVEALGALLDSIQDSFRDKVAGGVGRLEQHPESWGFVGMPIMRVFHMLRAARQAVNANSPRFLECGSGFGFIAALARELGFTVRGIEIVSEYIEYSRRFFPAVPVEQADLRTFNRFDEFNVIYYYGPFADDDVQAVFEHRIEEAIRPGGIILANRKVSQEWRTRGDFELLETDHALHWMIRKTTTPAR
jgi:hypothetical protein